MSITYERVSHDNQDTSRPSVLVFCPTVQLEWETVMTVSMLQYAGPIDYIFTRNNPKHPPQMNIVWNYQRGRQWFLDGGYDYMLTIENDMIIPPDSLDKLLETSQRNNADIVHGVYVFRHGQPSLNIIRYDQWESYSNPRNRAEWKKRWGTAFRAGGLGYGCTLIRRNVLERLEIKTKMGGGDSDSVLAEEARKLDMIVYADTRVICGHKRKDGTVLWPRKDGGYDLIGQPTPDLVRVRGVRAGVGVTPALGQDRRGFIIINPGDEDEIDREMAARFVSSGNLEYVNP